MTECHQIKSKMKTTKPALQFPLPKDECFSNCTHFDIFTGESPSFITHIQQLVIRLKLRLGFISESNRTFLQNLKRGWLLLPSVLMLDFSHVLYMGRASTQKSLLALELVFQRP